MFTTLGGALITSIGNSTDVDASAFISAANITASTQIIAVNNLVLDLKEANLWDKMIAIYPFVGGTASSHRFNLKDPRDANNAYRLSFSGGVTHSSTGVQPNGSNGWSNTFISGTSLPSSNTHISYYSRTTGMVTAFEMGFNPGGQFALGMYIRRTNNLTQGFYYNQTPANLSTINDNDGSGFYISTFSGTGQTGKIFRNAVLGSVLGTPTRVATSLEIYLFALNNGSPILYTTRQCAFASVGNGLTDNEVSQYTDIVEKYQTTLNRQVIRPTFGSRGNIPITFHDESIKFFSAASITDLNQRIAVDNLVRGLKLYDLWNKMKAIYPFVGGNATSHSYNLKDPRNVDAAFRLIFLGGGWTHTSNGIQGNGTSSYANTFLVPSTDMTNNNTHISIYSRIHIPQFSSCMIGTSKNPSFLPLLTIYGGGASIDCYSYASNRINNNTGILTGLFINSRVTSTNFTAYINSTIIGTNTTTNPLDVTTIDNPIFIGGINLNGIPSQYNPNQYSFASVGNGLTDAEASIFYNLVQNYQLQLNRQV